MTASDVMSHVTCSGPACIVFRQGMMSVCLCVCVCVCVHGAVRIYSAGHNNLHGSVISTHVWA